MWEVDQITVQPKEKSPNTNIYAHEKENKRATLSENAQFSKTRR